MADDRETAAPEAASDVETEAAAGFNKDDFVADDVLLNMLVHLAEKGVTTSISVFTSGLVMTGVLTSRKTYFEESAEMLKNSGLEVLFNELLSHTPADDDEAPAPDYAFVHLKNAQVITPGQNGMPVAGMLMRLKRSEIVGFSLGQLKTAE